MLPHDFFKRTTWNFCNKIKRFPIAPNHYGFLGFQGSPDKCTLHLKNVGQRAYLANQKSPF